MSAPIPADVARSLDPLIRRLASDNDHEVLACARALGRRLKAAGRDYNDLADAIARPRIAAPPPPPPQPPPWRQKVRECLDHHHLLTPREQKFLHDLVIWRSTPSERQLDWLDAIFDRVERSR
jgi:hypothetical protein